MSTATLVIGETGTGKSTSYRNMNPQETLLIQAIDKPLPFKADGWARWTPDTKGNIFVTDKAAEIQALCLGTKRKIIIIDDFQYVMANEFMRRSAEKGYEKFTEIGRNAWDILTMASALPRDVRVYLLSHSDTNDAGRVKAKTIGRMLDEKITVEGMFTIVMRTVVRDGEYLFSTRNNGSDTVKTPMGMFADELIPNDLQAVDTIISNYYPASSASVPK